MKIAIATPGRFHLLDLARELAAQGHEIHFYSFVPPERCEQFGLNGKHIKGFFKLPGIIEYVCRNFPLPFPIIRQLRNFNRLLLDKLVSKRLQHCDVMIGMSDAFVKSFTVARKKYSSTILAERGCKHILEQYRILNELKKSRVPSKSDIKRDLETYRLADYVVIASEHVRQSFLKHNYPDNKLFVNPYGTSLSKFYPTDKPSKDAYDVIMVGGWTYQKGCDLLAEACLNILGIKLLHVGGIADCPLPDHPLFTHIDSVDESKLRSYYAQTKIFALPSRQDGFGLVLSQALACGLPIVCSKDTGGSELAKFLEDKKWIVEIPETTVQSLAESIKKALELAASQLEGKRDYAGTAVEQLTWEAYGKRYDAFLKNL